MNILRRQHMHLSRYLKFKTESLTKLEDKRTITNRPYKVALKFSDKTAVKDEFGKHSYINILRRSLRLAKQMETQYGTEDYVDELIELSKPGNTSKIVLPTTFAEASESKEEEHDVIEDFNPEDNAMIIYTSGTTGRPKGVVLSHRNIMATSQDMAESWEWSKDDVSLHTLPLHHIHGLVNALLVPLSVGAECIMLPRFDAKEAWYNLLNGDVTVFTAVPTIYAKLLQYCNSANDQRLAADIVRESCQKVRLMISGSSGLPLPVLTAWEKLTSHRLLERYGMSEILMALTNPLNADRRPGTVGKPFSSVQTLIAREDESSKLGYRDVSGIVSDTDPDVSEDGELYVKGPTVFKEYWRRPDATREAFTADGWFKTGDTMCVDKDGYYKILGRTSVDIIKSGGYKISALDVEDKLLLHPEIQECVVLGKPDEVYGQTVVALIVPATSSRLNMDDLKTWCAERLPKYQVPRNFLLQDSIPRNAMGKVNKKKLVKELFAPVTVNQS